MLVNNTVFFSMLIFSGANISLDSLPRWMQVVSSYIPLTRGIASTRLIVAGAGINEILHLLVEEFLIGLFFTLLGFFLFSMFEKQAKKLGTLEIF